MKNLYNKKILLIICGGVAAYKSLDLIRSLAKYNARVKTILTKNAKQFITPLSITALSKEKVYDDLFSLENEAEMDHISLSRWADLILVAPATANIISKLTFGASDDLASTVMLASNKDIFLVPAMNVRMWENPSTKDNVKKLNEYGFKFIGPEIGDMACGEYGEGKMTEPNIIIENISKYFDDRSINKKFSALVTAGPTHEYIDPIRYITNKSSGKQGYEIAKSLNKKGFKTTLISGPTNLEIEDDINLIKVETAEQMFKETQKNLPADVAVFSAAVSDFKPQKKQDLKIKKKDFLNIHFEKNLDILSYVSNHNSLRPKLVIGFSAETNDLDKNSKKKLSEKKCDWIIGNDVSNKSIGFDSDFNEVTIFYKKGNEEKLSYKKKFDISDEIVDKILDQLNN